MRALSSTRICCFGQDFRKLEAQRMLPRLFLCDISPFDGYLASRTGYSGEASHLAPNVDVGGKEVAPSTN